MSDIIATRKAPGARAGNVALWVLQAVLAFQFAGGGLLKLTGSPEMVDLFATIGAGQWLRYLVGALEVAGAVGLLVPRLSGLAALGLAALMAGATVTNLFVLGESPWLPVGLLLVSAVIAWGRRPRTKAWPAGSSADPVSRRRTPTRLSPRVPSASAGSPAGGGHSRIGDPTGRDALLQQECEPERALTGRQACDWQRRHAAIGGKPRASREEKS